MSSRRIFGLTFLALFILSFRPSFGIYPLVIGPEVDLEMVADLQLIEEGMNGKPCGLALFVCGSSALCSSAVLFSDEYVLTSTRSFNSFGLLDHGKDTGISYLPSNTKGIVIFQNTILSELRDEILAFMQPSGDYGALITYLKEMKIDFAEIKGSVCCNNDADGVPFFDVGIHRIERHNPVVQPPGFLQSEELKTFVAGKNPDVVFYGYGKGFTHARTGWFRRGGVLPAFTFVPPHIRIPFSKPDDLLGVKKDQLTSIKTPKVCFGLMGLGDEGGPLLVQGKLLGIGQGPGFKYAHPQCTELVHIWREGMISGKKYPAFFNSVVSLVTPVFSQKTQSYLRWMARVLIK